MGNGKFDLEFDLKRWCYWQSSALIDPPPLPNGEVLPSNDGHADVSFLPMMQRRRLSPMAKAACAVAWHCRQHCGDMPTVFYSQHGESQHYFAMMEDMASNEPISPSRFSLSVHNAIAGQFSIYSGSTQPYVCLAGGPNGLYGGFLEAAGLLLNTAQVMLVCYDQPLPTAYHRYLPGDQAVWAMAMVLAA